MLALMGLALWLLFYGLTRVGLAAELAPADDPRWKDPRFCGFVPRDAHNHIKRSSKVLSDFQQIWPCPATRSKTGPCHGWAKDHVLPLSRMGCDSVGNLQWMPLEIKACKASTLLCKDRYELDVYSGG